MIGRALLALAFGLSSLGSAVPAKDSGAALLDVVHGFYGWVLRDGARVAELQPVIKEVSGTTRLMLDRGEEPAFAGAFVKSGYFAQDFPAAIARYYDRYSAQLDSTSQAEFDQMARDGRGPLMEVEDMDLFFCAQEYAYRQGFVDSLKVTAAAAEGDTARLEIVSSYGWPVTFRFRREHGRWLIRGYGVYQ
ncbi:MAG: hypothetical protein U0527_14975 [Candidatus Eisenbacteria bacterium]